MEAGAKGANAACDERKKDKEIEQFCPSELRDEYRDQKGRKRLTDGADAINETSRAAVQLIGESVEYRHGGHEDIDAINQNSHQRDGDGCSEPTAACQDRMEKTDEGEREEHSGAKNHAPFTKPTSQSVGGDKRAQESEQFEVGGEVVG